MPTYVKKMRERDGTDAVVGGRLVDQYRVMGPANQIDALNATDSVTGQQVPKRGDTHPDDPQFIVMDRSIVWQDISAELGDIWIVQVSYQKPQWEFVANSLEWKWETELLSVPSSVDVNGKALLNAAGFPIVGSYSRPIFVLSLYIWFDAVFLPATAKAVMNRVNSVSQNIFAGTAEAFSVDAGNMLCRQFVPISPQKTSGNTQRIQAVFSFQDGSYPWFLHAPNQSYSGWSAGPVPGNFKVGQDDVAEPVLLDNTGLPLVSGYTVNGAAPIVSPAVPSWVQYETVGDTYEAIFETLDNYNFTGFIAGVM